MPSYRKIWKTPSHKMCVWEIIRNQRFEWDVNPLILKHPAKDVLASEKVSKYLMR